MVAERGVDCEHMQVLVTNILHTGSGKRNRWDAGALGIFRYKTACMASALVLQFGCCITGCDLGCADLAGDEPARGGSLAGR